MTAGLSSRAGSILRGIGGLPPWSSLGGQWLRQIGDLGQPSDGPGRPPADTPAGTVRRLQDSLEGHDGELRRSLGRWTLPPRAEVELYSQMSAELVIDVGQELRVISVDKGHRKRDAADLLGQRQGGDSTISS